MSEVRPQFQGERLREAREARQLSGTALADLLGVTRQAVSQYEGGKQNPRPDIMGKICECLNLSPAFFLRNAPPIPDAPLYFRSLASATKGSRLRAVRRYGWLREMVGFLGEFVDFPPVNFPTFDVPDVLRLTFEQIEAFARQARQFWNMGEGPISNLVLLLENNGAVVSRTDLEAEALDGFSQWAPNDRPYVILNSAKRSCARSRFDAAHELAHLLLHRDVDRRLFTKSSEHRQLEDQAHRFASAFLLPQRSFAAETYTVKLDAFRELKPRWKVSVATMIHRAADLKFVDGEEATRLWINLGRRGWRQREPYDDELDVEQPRFLARAFELILESRAATREQIRARLPFATKDLEELSGLPRGFLREHEAVIEQLGPRLKDASSMSEPATSEMADESPETTETDPKIVPFPDKSDDGTW